MTTVHERQHPVNSSRSRAAVRSPAGDALSAMVVRILRLNGLLAAEGEAIARPAGQTTARWQVLAMVENEPMTVAGIARTLGLARQSVQRVADLLADAGLVVYEDNPRHRRARLVRLTANGRSTLEMIQASQAPWANAIGETVGERELRRATDVLDRVLATIRTKGIGRG